MSISVKIYQITSPCDGDIYKLWKQLGDNLPHYGVLEGTRYMYLIVIPNDINCINNTLDIFKKYNVEYISDSNIDYTFDSDKFNSNYKIGVTYFGNDYYVLEKPFNLCHSLNGIKINEDGYPIDEENNIIPNTLKFPANNTDPNWSHINKHNFKIIKSLNKFV